MKIVSAILLLWLAGCAAQPSSPQSIATVALERRSTAIDGALGLALGTVTDVEATVVVAPPPFIVGSGLGRWYGLRIDKIHGRRVKNPPTMKFEVEGTLMVKLASNDSDLEALWHRLSAPGEFHAIVPEGVESAHPLSAARIEGLRSAYIGSRHNLLVYETARFFGNPHGIPEKYGFIFGPGTEYGFESVLRVFDELEEPNQPPPTR